MPLFLALATCGDGREPPSSPLEGWQIVREGKLVRLECERALYERAGSVHFFVRLRVTNLGASTLGLDLRDYWLVPRPNQWGGLRTSERRVINEKRVEAKPLDEERRRHLLAAFAEGLLESVSAKGRIDLFIEFNASARSDVDAVDLPYLYVSLDGQLFVTDGKAFDNLTLEWGTDDDFRSSLMMSTPVSWGTVPPDAVVVTSP